MSNSPLVDKNNNLQFSLQKVDQKEAIDQMKQRQYKNEQLQQMDKGSKKVLMKARSLHKDDKEYKSNMESKQLQRSIKKTKQEDQKFPGIRVWPWLLQDLDKNQLFRTVLCGVIMCFIMIPQNMAYALMIGIPPQYGVYTGCYGSLVYAIFGGSRHVSVGPITTNFLMIAKAVNQVLPKDATIDDKVNCLLFLTFMIGVLLTFMGFIKLGFIENAYSVPTITGYIKAAYLIIIVEQFAKTVQMHLEGDSIFIKIYNLIINFNDNANIPSLILGAIVFFLFAIVNFIQNRWMQGSLLMPTFPLVLTVVGTLIVQVFELDTKYNIQTAKNFPEHLPTPRFPTVSSSIVFALIPDAIKIAIVSFSEALLIAKEIAQKEQYKISTTHEFYTYGISNLFTPLFGGMCSFASVCRTPIQQMIGSVNHLAGLITGSLMLIILIFFVDIVRIIPIPLISSIVCFTSWKSFYQVFSTTKPWFKFFIKDFVMFFVTFVLCLCLSLADALLLSVVISLLWILKRNSKPTWFFKPFVFENQDQMINCTINNTMNNRQGMDNLSIMEYYTNDKQQQKKQIQDVQRSISQQISPEIFDISMDVGRKISHINRSDQSNQEVPEQFIKDIMEQQNNQNPYEVDIAEPIKLPDLCFCHNITCQKRCHIVVVQLQGHLSYVNCKSLKEQAEYMSRMIDPNGQQVGLKDNNNNQVFVNLQSGLQIKGVIYECDNLSTVDISALKTIKDMMEILRVKSGVVIKFSQVPEHIIEAFFNSELIKGDMIMDCKKSTFGNVYSIFKEIIQISRDNYYDQKQKAYEKIMIKDENLT